MKKVFTLIVSFFAVLILINKANSQLKNEASNLTAPARIIDVDVYKIKGPTSKVWQKCVGAGRANEGLRADWQQQLRLVKKEIGFEYIRMHALLNDDMGVYFEDKDGNPIYNWQYIDQLYDFLVDIKVRPFVEVSFMPKALASGDKTIFWWKGNVTPPKSYDKWHDLIKAMTLHFTERYGKEEVEKWYFEIWNEPNLPGFFTGTQADYFKMYDYAAKAIKSVNAKYKVGGPATAGNAWIPETINHCVDNNIPIDFIATHTYGAAKGFLDEFGKKVTVMQTNPKAVTIDVENARKQIAASKMPNLELHYTEWSSSYTPSDPIHDSYHSGAYILDKIKGTEKIANSMSYWVFTDIFEEPGPRYTPLHGGFGLLNYQGIKKPAYYVYQFLNKLGNVEIHNADSSSWVCKNNKGDIQSLIWDFKPTFPEDNVPNQIYYKRDLPAKDKGITQLKIAHVPFGKYRLKITKVGYQSNDAYATYMKLGSPSQLSIPQVATIKKQNAGLPYIDQLITISNKGFFNYSLFVKENDCYLVELIKI